MEQRRGDASGGEEEGQEELGQGQEELGQGAAAALASAARDTGTAPPPYTAVYLPGPSTAEQGWRALAGAGLLSAWAAGLGMALSSLLVVLNALRLSGKTPLQALS